MKLKYIPGLRPVPMLMYYNDVNVEIFNEFANIHPFNVEFYSNYTHYWNINAYLIYDEKTNTIKSMVFNIFAYALYLLRTINKDVTIEINNDIYQLIKKDLDELKGEIEVIP